MTKIVFPSKRFAAMLGLLCSVLLIGRAIIDDRRRGSASPKRARMAWVAKPARFAKVFGWIFGASMNGARAAGWLSDSIDGRWPLKLPITLLLHNEARRMGMAGLWRHRGSRLADRASSPSEKRPCWGWVSRFHAIRPAWADFERGGAGPAESVSSRSRPIVFMGAMQCRAHIFSAIRAIIFCF